MDDDCRVRTEVARCVSVADRESERRAQLSRCQFMQTDIVFRMTWGHAHKYDAFHLLRADSFCDCTYLRWIHWFHCWDCDFDISPATTCLSNEPFSQWWQKRTIELYICVVPFGSRPAWKHDSRIWIRFIGKPVFSGLWWEAVGTATVRQKGCRSRAWSACVLLSRALCALTIVWSDWAVMLCVCCCSASDRLHFVRRRCNTYH